MCILCEYFVHGQILEYSGRCVIVNESDAPALVAYKYGKLGNLPEVRQLARDVIRWECRPYPSMQPPPLAYFVKVVGPDAHVIPMFRQISLVDHFCVIYLY